MAILIGYMLKLFTAVVAFFVMRLSLSRLDKHLDFDFKEWFFNASSEEKAKYLGLRFVGICLLFGFILL